VPGTNKDLCSTGQVLVYSKNISQFCCPLDQQSRSNAESESMAIGGGSELLLRPFISCLWSKVKSCFEMHRIPVLLFYVSTHVLYVKTNLEYSKFEALKDMFLAYHNLPISKTFTFQTIQNFTKHGNWCASWNNLETTRTKNLPLQRIRRYSSSLYLEHTTWFAPIFLPSFRLNPNLNLIIQIYEQQHWSFEDVLLQWW